MGTGLDHALLCVACFLLKMLHYYVIVCYKLCELYTWKNVYRKRRTLGLENITLGVRRTK